MIVDGGIAHAVFWAVQWLGFAAGLLGFTAAVATQFSSGRLLNIISNVLEVARYNEIILVGEVRGFSCGNVPGCTFE
jgi:hypothetical protein